MNVFVFDIETVPDVVSARRLYGLDGLDDKHVAEIMFQKQRQATGGDFLRHHLHRVVAISVCLRSADRLKVWSLGETDSPERELIARFFDGLDRYTPNLVSWNGSGFDLPVLHYRALLHGVAAPRYWETGDDDTSFRWNNYLNRFHSRHTDLMDVLAGYQGRANAPLDEVALLLGLPGKLGMDGARVWQHYLDGDVGAIRDYCETDVLNTYLIYLRFELMRGRLREDAYDVECEHVRASIAREKRPHLDAFLRAWTAGGE
ncbi:MAG: 3'-5' exonuclease [Gammaproteobacteria bacterium]|nr:3'-5' exonuclease [Gammaproteobacteria bacterium]